MTQYIQYTPGSSPADKIFTKAIWQAAGSPTEVELGQGWTSIGQNAFKNTAITSITIPASVTSIGSGAFFSATSLQTVTFAGSGLETIISYAFYQTTSLQTITFASNSVLESIGSASFQRSGITSIEIPASVTSIGQSAFNSTDLTSIEIPASVTTIGDQAFLLAASLQTVTFAAYSQLATIGGTGIFFNSGLTTFTAPLSPVLNLFGVSVGTNQTVSNKTGVSVIDNTPPPEPSCFPAGTPIQTDQGETLIEQLVPSEHTLRGKNIIAITQTRPLQKHIVCFEKDSIGKNVPSQQTLCSKEHKVLYQGEMIKARDLADMCKNVKKVAYNGETLYNVLLEKHGKMLVNNMICETLHPENIAAKYAKMENKSEKRILTR